jgi:hypothetical protein
MNFNCIVYGTWNSGSGAISDYLSSRDDLYNPFGENEFKLITDPDGLFSFYLNSYKTKSLLLQTNAFNNYLLYVKNLCKYKVYKEKNKNVVFIYPKEILNITNLFLKKITVTSYFGLPHYKNLSRKKIDQLLLKLKCKFLNKDIKDFRICEIVSLVDEQSFIYEAKKYIKQILRASSKEKINNKNIILNNAVEPLDPINSSIFFENKKLICVTRDPRDIYSSMKRRKANATPWYDVHIFIKWFKNNFDNKNFRDLQKNNSILWIKYENFINKFQYENKRICNYLSIAENFNFKNDENERLFDLNISSLNLYKSKKNLSIFEMRSIENALNKFLQW